jgi:Metallo-beta-lactamase superfamily
MTASTLPEGLRHWTAVHPNIGSEVSSYALVPEGVVLNPLLPDGDRGVLDGCELRAIVLTNRHHVRDAERLATESGVAIHAPAVGLDDLRGLDAAVAGYADREGLPGGLQAIEVGVLSPDEFAVLAPQYRALAVADGARRKGDGPLEAMPDGLLGDDPEAVRRGLGERYAELAAELEFDHLLLAHGLPVIGDGRGALARYAASLR